MPKGKGSGFEREMCKALGLWITKGERDDIFWRSSNSGGRAKVRSYQGLSTFGQYGDVQATDPLGQPLMDLCVIELKRGYNRASIGDVLDRGERHALQPWEKFLGQVLVDRFNAARPYWLLITRRDQREAVIFLPWDLYTVLNLYGACLNKVRPFLKLIPRLKDPELRPVIFATHLSSFLHAVTPDMISALHQDCR